VKLWKTKRREPLLSFGKFLTVERHAVELPDGRVIDDWPWLVTPDFVNIVVVTKEGHYAFFRQVKYAIEGETLAVIGGYIEPGEDPLTAAQRELREETGYHAEEWVAMGSYRVDTNRGAGMAYLFLAREAVAKAETTADDLEEQHLVLLERQQVEQAIKQGEFKGLPWAAAVALALVWSG
jgi:ADP-ribose pyrophosphatase